MMKNESLSEKILYRIAAWMVTPSGILPIDTVKFLIFVANYK